MTFPPDGEKHAIIGMTRTKWAGHWTGQPDNLGFSGTEMDSQTGQTLIKSVAFEAKQSSRMGEVYRARFPNTEVNKEHDNNSDRTPPPPGR